MDAMRASFKHTHDVLFLSDSSKVADCSHKFVVERASDMQRELDDGQLKCGLKDFDEKFNTGGARSRTGILCKARKGSPWDVFGSMIAQTVGYIFIDSADDIHVIQIFVVSLQEC